MQKEHFFLGNQIAEPRSFTPRAKVVPPPVIPERNRQEHAAFIKESIWEVLRSFSLASPIICTYETLRL